VVAAPRSRLSFPLRSPSCCLKRRNSCGNTLNVSGGRTWEAVQPAKEWIGDVRRKAPAREQHTKHNSAESSHQVTKIISVPVTRRSL
jgi:hypothetical protein